MDYVDPLKTRDECQSMAQQFADEAAHIAHRAEQMSQREDRHKVPGTVAVGALFADIARIWAALAQSAPPAEEVRRG